VSLKKENNMAKEKSQSKEMTLEEAKAFRASLAKPQEKILTDKDKREAFRSYWSQNKKKYGMTNKLEEILWLHLVSTKNDSPEKFENGLKNFGIKKI
jgi:hypothetical protein